MIEIKTPRGVIASGKNGTSARLIWTKSFGKKRTVQFNKCQCFIDSEVLRGCAKYIPLQTGMLVKSGTLGTVIGTGEIQYIALYARQQYYHNKGLGQDKNRGPLWFERWKSENKKTLLSAVQTQYGGQNE